MWFVAVCTLYCSWELLSWLCEYSLEVTARIVGELFLVIRRKGKEINVPDCQGAVKIGT